MTHEVDGDYAFSEDAIISQLLKVAASERLRMQGKMLSRALALLTQWVHEVINIPHEEMKVK